MGSRVAVWGIFVLVAQQRFDVSRWQLSRFTTAKVGTRKNSVFTAYKSGAKVGNIVRKIAKLTDVEGLA